MANNTEKWAEEEEPNSFLLGEDRSAQPGFVRQNRRQSSKTILRYYGIIISRGVCTVLDLKFFGDIERLKIRIIV